MLNYKKIITKIFNEIAIFFLWILIASIVLAITFVILVDYSSNNIPVIFAPIEAVYLLSLHNYDWLLLLPYILYIIIRLINCCRKDTRWAITTLNNYSITSIIFLIIYIILAPKFFDCAINMSYEFDGDFFRGKYDVCYSIAEQVSPVVYLTFPVKSIDSLTFKRLNHGYAKDQYRVYYDYVYCDNYLEGFAGCTTLNINKLNVGIKEADSKTFQVLDEIYTKDKNHVYKYGQIFETADPTTFQVLKDGYAKDKNHVYKDGVMLPAADPATFQPPSIR